MKEYNKANIPLAKTLRKNMTPWERKLWYEFLRYYPIRFQRQKAIGNYIVDFYCAKARLVVELDGGGHYTPEQIEKDKVRTKELEGMNLIILRICNLDIDRNFSGVCEYIDLNVKKSLPQSASLTAPSKREPFYQIIFRLSNKLRRTRRGAHCAPVTGICASFRICSFTVSLKTGGCAAYPLRYRLPSRKGR